MALPRFFKSRSFPVSLSTASGNSLDDKWYQNLACCGLQSTDRASSLRQCTIIDLGEKALGVGITHKPALAIVTNHSVIPSLSDVKDWKLLAGPSAIFKLVEGKFLHCVSCCGPQGIYGRDKMHKFTLENPSAGSCPKNADWTLLILKQEFVTELMNHRSCKELKFPPVKVYSQDMLEKVEFHVYQRNMNVITQELVANQLMEPICTNTADTQKVENTVNLYRKNSILKLFPHQKNKGLAFESFGAAVFSESCISTEGASDDPLDRVSLLALYCPTTSQMSHPPAISSDCQDTEIHCAVAIHHIVDVGLMALGDGTYCELVPCLAFLREVPPHLIADSISRLNLCLGQCKNSLGLPKMVELLEFILKPEEVPPVVNLSRAPSITRRNAQQKQVHLELLTTIFSQFNRSEPSDLMKAIGMPQEGNPPPSIYPIVEKPCNQLLRLMKHCAEVEGRDAQVIPVVQAGFALWQEMLHFNHVYPNGSTTSLLSNECFEVARKIKSWEDCRDNIAVQLNFGKISEWYLAKLKGDHSMVSSNQQQKIAELEQKISSLEHHLSATTSEQKQRIANLEQHNVSLEHQSADLQQEISALKVQKEQFEGEQARKVQQKLSDMQREKALFEKERAEQLQRIQELEKEIKEAHKSHNETVSNLKSSLEERGVKQSLEEKLTQQRIQELQQQLDAAQQEKQSLTSSHQHQARKTQETLEQRHRLDMQQQEQRITELEHQLQASKEANIQLQMSQEKAKKNMKSQLEAERRVLLRKCEADIDQHSQKIKEELSNSLATLQEKNLAMEQLGSEIKQQQQLFEMQTKELEKVKEENAALSAEKEERNEKLHALNEEVNVLKRHHEVNVAVIQQLRSGPTSPRTQRARGLSMPVRTPEASPHVWSSRRWNSSLLNPKVDLDFPNMDIVTLLEEDLSLRDEIAKHFVKVQGAHGKGGTWEDLLFCLDQHYGIIMDAKSLDGSLIGDILLSIVKTWGKKTKVTVTSFCQICEELGNTRVVEILAEAKNTFDRRRQHPC